MGNILCDWNLDEKRLLLAKAYAALPAGGALIVYDGLIDDDRRERAMSLLVEPPHADRDARGRPLHRGGLPRLDGGGRASGRRPSSTSPA